MTIPPIPKSLTPLAWVEIIVMAAYGYGVIIHWSMQRILNRRVVDDPEVQVVKRKWGIFWLKMQRVMGDPGPGQFAWENGKIKFNKEDSKRHVVITYYTTKTKVPS